MPRSLKVLLVEDHALLAELMTIFLERLNHTVTGASSLAEALRTLSAERFDLLVSDYALADGTAVELVRRVRETLALPAICVSGHGDDVREVCREAGFDAYLMKPVDLATLEATIAALGLCDAPLSRTAPP